MIASDDHPSSAGDSFTSSEVTSTLTTVDSKFRPSPLALAVLSLLVAGPLHPYGIQRLIKQWGKDKVVNVGQRANLYKTINRLHEAGLIAVRQTERDQQYPERTVYELTEDGRRRCWAGWPTCWRPPATSSRSSPPRSRSRCCWIRRGPVRAGTPGGRPPGEPGPARARPDGPLRSLPRVTLLDDEYLRAVTAAELNWISGVLDDLRTGVMTWSEEELTGLANEELTGLANEELTA